MAGLKEKEQENALNEVRLLASYDEPYIIGFKVLTHTYVGCLPGRQYFIHRDGIRRRW